MLLQGRTLKVLFNGVLKRIEMGDLPQGNKGEWLIAPF